MYKRFSSGVVSNHEVFFSLMQDVTGGWMKPRGSVKMIQQDREQSSSSLPFCHLRRGA